MILPSQVRAARALLDWRQIDLANAAGVSDLTVKNFEGDVTNPWPETLAAIRKALETAGVIFLDEKRDGPGVRLRKGKHA